MKLSENWFQQDGQIVQQQTHDFTPTMDLAQSLRSDGANGFGDSKLVGVVDAGMMGMWATEAGIKGSDPAYWEKMQDLVKKKMLDGDFAKLRVWEGSY